jgi:hypothetical protein
MQLDVQPLVAPADRKGAMRVMGLPPGGGVTLRASMRLPWAMGEAYTSVAQFSADACGTVDLSRRRPDAGTYDFVERMGPIVSMMRSKTHDAGGIGRNISVDAPLEIDLVAEHAGEAVSARREPAQKRMRRPVSWLGAALMVAVWLVVARVAVLRRA